MAQRTDSPSPPAPPEIRHRLAMPRRQWIALALIAIVPVLALLGVFGITRDRASATSGALRLEVDYPSRLRHKVLDRIELLVTNVGPHVIDSAEVAIDTAYLAHFSDVTVTPTPPERAFVVPVAGLAPGGHVTIVVQVRAEGPGRHTGTLEARRPRSAGARVPVATLVFP